MGTRYFLLLLFAAACSQSHASTMQASPDPIPVPGVTPLRTNHSGSRLKLLIACGDDNSTRTVGWYDSKFKWECTEGITADGKTRCIPSHMSFYGDNYFSDENCVSPIIAVDSCGVPAAARISVGCERRMQIYRLEVLYTGPVYLRSRDGCAVTGATSGLMFWQVGTEIAPTDFVELTRATAE